MNKKATSAIKDILYMYKVLTDYSGLYDDFGTEDGSFDPSEFVDCNASEYDVDEDELNLLHQGSAIKLICSVYQAWSQGGYPHSDSGSANLARSLIEEGRLGHLPELESVLNLALVSIVDAEEQFHSVYDKYVVGYFESLIRNVDA